MKSKKVRPMLDKELRDEVVGYCGGVGSFNEALGWLIKGHRRLIAKNKEQAEERKSRSEMKSELMFTKLELQGNKSQLRMLMAENQALKNQLKRDAQELNKLKNINAELSTKLEGKNKACNSLIELCMKRKDRGFSYFCMGVAIGAAMMVFAFNLM